MIEYTEGMAVDDQFELVDRLGAGGFGTVFRARNRLDGRDYAIKFVKSDDPDAVRREFAPLRAIDHPNIVKAHWAARTKDGVWYIAFDLVEGTRLREEIEVAGPMPTLRVAEIGDQLLDALAALHPDEERLAALHKGTMTDGEYEERQRIEAAGLVHRDLKPENLILCEDNTLVLVDFGIASRAGTRRVTFTWTRGYLPPDLAVSALDTWDPDVDRYAAGVVLFECATGVHPERLLETGETIDAAIGRVPSLDAGLAAFLRRACAEQRADRFASTAEMAAAWAAWDRPERFDPAATDEDALVALIADRDARLEPCYVWEPLEMLRAAELTDGELGEVLVDIVVTDGPVLCWDLYDTFTGVAGPTPVSRLNRIVYRAVTSGKLRQIEAPGGGQQDKTVYAPSTDPYALRAIGPRRPAQIPNVELDAWINWYTSVAPTPLRGREALAKWLPAIYGATADDTTSPELDTLVYRIELRLRDRN
ncbi:MAG: serine/threonine-protein kinase [Acidimicrobiia bacterium]